MSVRTTTYVDSPDGLALGVVIRYIETERKTGRWVNRGTVDRVKWRAVPTDDKAPITYHNRKRDAIAAITELANVLTEES